MLKITVEVKDKDKESCSVKIVAPKDWTKGSETERNCCALVKNAIEKVLKEME